MIKIERAGYFFKRKNILSYLHFDFMHLLIQNVFFRALTHCVDIEISLYN